MHPQQRRGTWLSNHNPTQHYRINDDYEKEIRVDQYCNSCECPNLCRCVKPVVGPLQALTEYRAELRDDPIINTHLAKLYDNLLEQNLIRVIEPFSRVQVSAWECWRVYWAYTKHRFFGSFLMIYIFHKLQCRWFCSVSSVWMRWNAAARCWSSFNSRLFCCAAFRCLPVR